MSRATEDTNRRMLRARDAMDRSYAEPLDIARLARIAVVSERHFIRTFRAVFGETPHRYLQRRRVERAMFLLRTTDRRVTDVCFDTGFGSLGHVQPHVHGDRRGVAERLPRPRGGSSGAVVLRHGVDPAELVHARRR